MHVLAESDTHLVSLTAVLMFRVTPVMSDEPQQTLQAEREREREPRGGAVAGLLAECMAVMRQTEDTTVVGTWLQFG